VPRITAARVTPIAFRDPPLLNSAGVHEPWALRSIIEVEIEGEVTGLGETYGDEPFLTLLRRCAEAIVGLDIHDLNWVKRAAAAVLAQDADLACAAKPKTVDEGVAPRLYGAFDVALLDAWGKLTGTRLCDLLGGAVREEVPFSAYLFYKLARHKDLADGWDDGWGEVLTPEQMVGEARRMMAEHGFGSLKLKGGVFDPEEEIAALEAMHAAFPGAPLRIDPNGAWHVHTTLKLLRRLEGVLEYLEDPVLGIPSMAVVQNATQLPLATNMCVVAFDHFPQAVRLGAVQVVLADHHYWGGLRATVELARLCSSFGLGLSMHSNSHLGISLMAMTHVAAAIPDLTYACDTHYPWQGEDVIAGGRIPIRNGGVSLPKGPGLGVELDRDALARLHEQYQRCGIRRRDDAGEMRKYRPDWVMRRPRF
jgi:glucarate dehydratase